MRIPEVILYDKELPFCECLLLLPGAVIGKAEDEAARLLGAEGIAFEPEGPVREIRLKDVPAEHILCGVAKRLDAGDPSGAEFLKQRLREAVAVADTLGIKEMSFMALPAQSVNSRLFGMMTVFFRELMEDRERHPSLSGIRFLCSDRKNAAMIAQVYNFYYPADISERMEVPEV